MRHPVFRLSSLVVAFAALTALPSAADGPFHYYVVTPCRLADTRNPNGLNGGPVLSSGVPRAFRVQNSTCNVPAGAKAVQVNITAVTPTNAGFLTLYPSNVGLPSTSNINFVAGDVIAINAPVALADNVAYPNDLTVFPGVNGGIVHVILDVVGYYK